MDTFKITQLKLETTLGLYPFEKKIKQTILIDLEFTLDIKKAAASNSLDDTIDYSRLACELTTFIETRSFLLLESLAEQVVAFLKNNFDLKNLKLKISKIGCISNAKEVTLEITR